MSDVFSAPRPAADPAAHPVFHQATGMIVVQLGVDAADAAARLRAAAGSLGLDVLVAARRVVARQLRMTRAGLVPTGSDRSAVS